MQAVSIRSAEKLLGPFSDIVAPEASKCRAHYKVLRPKCSRVSK